jgi:hypothetical protein
LDTWIWHAQTSSYHLRYFVTVNLQTILHMCNTYVWL